MKIRKRDGTMVEVSDGYVLRDGEAMMVEAMFMDSLIHDGSGGPAGQRPGFLVSDNRQDEAVRETVYRMYADTISNRWRSHQKPSQTFDGSEAARAASYEQYRADIENRWRR